MLLMSHAHAISFMVQLINYVKCMQMYKTMHACDHGIKLIRAPSTKLVF